MNDTSDNLPVFHGRTSQAVTPAAAQQIQDTMLQKAQALAQMGSSLPQAYRGPGGTGAMLMALDYAQRNDLAIMDVVRWVSWLNGKPIIETDLAVQIANRQGIRVIVTDEGTEGQEARARLIGPDGETSEWETYTIDEAKSAGLVKPKSAWDTHPRSMLRHRARKLAIQFQGPGLGATVVPSMPDDPGDEDPPADDLEPDPADRMPAFEPEPEVELHDEPDPEPFEFQAPPTPDDPTIKDTELPKQGPTATELRDGIQNAGWERSDVGNWLAEHDQPRDMTAIKLAQTDLGRALMATLQDDIARTDA